MVIRNIMFISDQGLVEMATKITYDYIKKFAKSCGFDFERSGKVYVLKTPYGERVRTTLKEVEKVGSFIMYGELIIE